MNGIRIYAEKWVKMGIICELDVGVGEGEKVLKNKVIWHIVKNLSMFGDDNSLITKIII